MWTIAHSPLQRQNKLVADNLWQWSFLLSCSNWDLNSAPAHSDLPLSLFLFFLFCLLLPVYLLHHDFISSSTRTSNVVYTFIPHYNNNNNNNKKQKNQIYWCMSNTKQIFFFLQLFSYFYLDTIWDLINLTHFRYNTLKKQIKNYWFQFSDWFKAAILQVILPAFRLGPVYRGQFGEVLSFFTTDRPHYILKCPHFLGTITAEWFRLCVRSPSHHISRMRTFDENSCAISITSPRSLSPPRTQHVWWDHREKSRRASTLWDCRGKSCLAGLSPVNRT